MKEGGRRNGVREKTGQIDRKAEPERKRYQQRQSHSNGIQSTRKSK